jgi:hypothetical protein
MRLAVSLSLLAGVMAAPGWALVVDGGILRQSGDGRFVLLDPATPFNVGADTFDDDNLYAFDEDQNITLPVTISVDIGGDAEGTIATGTVVASHYVFFDSVSSFHYGYVVFDAPILGVAAFEPTMAATDFLANTAVTYINADLRGLEPGDYVWIDKDDPHRLWVHWAGSSPGDYIRVFTERSEGAAMM